MWKEQKGIDTWVVTTAAIGTDAAAIKAYIQSVYDAPLGSNLAYVLFLGDVEIVPTNYVAKTSDAVGSPPSMGSDLPYAQLDASGDARADVAHGRISADTLDQADDVVDKILDYEKTPSFDAATYNSLLFAGYFQDDVVRDGTADRPYINVLEEIRNVLLGRGKTIDRFYDNNSLPDVAAGPLVFNDGTPLPAELLLANGFDWDASASDIQGAFNAGRAIAWHRDHGSRDGWSRPGFSISNLAGLSNGDVDPADEYEDRLPVVFSINCTSGRFDQETDPVPPLPVRESFAEEILRLSDGGAVAVIAASRASSTSRNQVVSRGLFDGLWSEVVTNFNPSMASNPLPTTLRLGDVLNYAKEWVLTTYPDPADAYTIDQVEMYHLHGDPTLEVWTARPATFAPTLVWIERTPGNFVLQLQVFTGPGAGLGDAPPRPVGCHPPGGPRHLGPGGGHPRRQGRLDLRARLPRYGHRRRHPLPDLPGVSALHRRGPPLTRRGRRRPRAPAASRMTQLGRPWSRGITRAAAGPAAVSHGGGHDEERCRQQRERRQGAARSGVRIAELQE